MGYRISDAICDSLRESTIGLIGEIKKYLIINEEIEDDVDIFISINSVTDYLLEIYHPDLEGKVDFEIGDPKFYDDQEMAQDILESIFIDYKNTNEINQLIKILNEDGLQFLNQTKGDNND